MVMPEGDEFADSSETAQEKRTAKYLNKLEQERLRKVISRTRIPIDSNDPTKGYVKIGIARNLSKDPTEIKHPASREALKKSRPNLIKGVIKDLRYLFRRYKP